MLWSPRRSAAPSRRIRTAPGNARSAGAQGAGAAARAPGDSSTAWPASSRPACARSVARARSKPSRRSAARSASRWSGTASTNAPLAALAASQASVTMGRPARSAAAGRRPGARGPCHEGACASAGARSGAAAVSPCAWPGARHESCQKACARRLCGRRRKPPRYALPQIVTGDVLQGCRRPTVNQGLMLRQCMRAVLQLVVTRNNLGSVACRAQMLHVGLRARESDCGLRAMSPLQHRADHMLKFVRSGVRIRDRPIPVNPGADMSRSTCLGGKARGAHPPPGQ